MSDWKQEVFEKMTKASNAFLGYPLAKDFSYEKFAPFLNICINNVGDPECPSTLTIDSKEIERKCVDFFTEILNGDPKKIWGYITSGGTEGNLYGLYVAREAFPNAIVYYSESTHYSVKKNLHLLKQPNIVIRSQENGEIDYEDLEASLSFRRDRPAIFFLNIGTTMTEAVDKLDKIKALIRKLAIKDFYIHCDAAFLGAIAPFVDNGPKFDFSHGVDSISISGHKFLGSPIPCGVVLVKRSHRDRVAHSVSYVDTLDTTISGSRNGLCPLFIWDFIQEKGIKGLKERAKYSQELARYTEQEMKKIGIPAWRNNEALTVVFPKPSKSIRTKFQLACDESIAHVICVPGITKEQIDELILDLKDDINNHEDEYFPNPYVIT
ncbi:MAG: histidine decarboxylase [Tenacibaculum sp.]|nr:histidine decarboxylase [Tenacibaculum sp.]